MADQIIILSVNGYMKKYAVDGIGKGADRWQVKRDMLDEFRREIFNLSVSKLGPKIFSNEWEGSDEDRKILENILNNAKKKWKSLCKEFAKYRETSGLIEEKDLQEYLEGRMSLADDEDQAADDNSAAIDEEAKALNDLREDVIHDETKPEETKDGTTET